MLPHGAPGATRARLAAASAALVLGLLSTPPQAMARATANAAATPSGEKTWRVQIVPYVWLPAMTGDVTVRGLNDSVDTSISDLFTETDAILSLAAEVEAWYRAKWGVAVNGQWSILEQNDDRLGQTQLRFDLTNNIGLFEFLGLYDAGTRRLGRDPDGPTWTLQPLVGVRVSVMKAKLDFQGGPSFDDKVTWADPIVGSRSIFRFGPEHRWNWTLRGDFGGFGAGSDFTWNVAGMLGYDFKLLGVDSTVLLGARALSQDYSTGAGSTKFAWDVTQYGPLLALALRF